MLDLVAVVGLAVVLAPAVVGLRVTVVPEMVEHGRVGREALPPVEGHPAVQRQAVIGAVMKSVDPDPLAVDLLVPDPLVALRPVVVPVASGLAVIHARIRASSARSVGVRVTNGQQRRVVPVRPACVVPMAIVQRAISAVAARRVVDRPVHVRQVRVRLEAGAQVPSVATVPTVVNGQIVVGARVLAGLTVADARVLVELIEAPAPTAAFARTGLTPVTVVIGQIVAVDPVLDGQIVAPGSSAAVVV